MYLPLQVLIDGATRGLAIEPLGELGPGRSLIEINRKTFLAAHNTWQ